MAMVFFHEPWYLQRNKYLFSYEVPEFRFLESEFQFSDSPDIGIQKKNPTGIFGIESGIGIPLTMGVPEIGTKNRNSQPRGEVLPQKSDNFDAWYRRLLIHKMFLQGKESEIHYLAPDNEQPDFQFVYVDWNVDCELSEEENNEEDEKNTITKNIM